MEFKGRCLSEYRDFENQGFACLADQGGSSAVREILEDS
jgi:hypothetical protein